MYACLNRRIEFFMRGAGENFMIRYLHQQIKPVVTVGNQYDLRLSVAVSQGDETCKKLSIKIQDFVSQAGLLPETTSLCRLQEFHLMLLYRL